MRPLAILWLVLTLVIAVAVGVGAYQYGLHDGISQQIQNLPANSVPAPGYGYPYYYGHWGAPFFPFFPLFPLFGFLFFVLILFAVFGRRRWYGPGGPHDPHDHHGGPGAHFEEWHRRAHESGASAEPPKQ
jgi:hypothetical protein